METQCNILSPFAAGDTAHPQQQQRSRGTSMDNSVELAELEALLRSMGVKDVEPRVVSQLLERLRRYTASLLYDGRDYANHAGRDKIEVADVRLAAQERKFGQVTDVPQRGVSDGC
jgi:histone H3/H4